MVIPFVSDPHALPVIVLYVGPDQIMPLASLFGAVFGLALMFWNRLVGLVHKCWTMVSRREDVPRKPSAG